MPITALPTPPSRTNPSQFSVQTDTFLAALPQFVADANSLAANLNAVAAGGAFSLPYIFLPTDLTANDGYVSFPDPSKQNTSNMIYINRVTAGKDVTALLNEYAASSSGVKGYLKIVKNSDPSKWLVFAISSVVAQTRYITVNGGIVFSSETNPFTNNDAIVVSFQRTGDKGVQGNTAAIYQVIVRDQRGANVSPQSLTGNTWNRRVLNTVVGNQIVGFQLGAAAANTFTLPAGTYWIEATAPAQNPSVQQLRLFNVTQNATYDVGGSDYSNSGSTSIPSTQRAILRTFLSTTADTVFAIEHYIGSAGPNGTGGTGGTPVGTVGEVYTELQIVKVG